LTNKPLSYSVKSSWLLKGNYPPKKGPPGLIVGERAQIRRTIRCHPRGTLLTTLVLCG